MTKRAKLMDWTKIEAAVYAARMCKDSIDRMDSFGDDLGPKDAELIRHLLQMDPPHESLLEHVVYRFELILSRACLQEERRTRMSSPSVKSSRFTLSKQLKSEGNIEEFLHKTGDEDVDRLIFGHMRRMELLATRRREEGRPVPNDIMKYALVEAFLTTEVVTINARSLRNVFKTRLGKGVLLEYRKLAWDIYDELPDEHQILFEDIVVKMERPKDETHL